MPAAKTTSNVSSKYGDAMKAAMERNKATPFRSGSVNLPAGIKRGIAKLEGCYFGSNDGGDFWRAYGTVDYPESVTVDGHEVPVYGLTTSVVVSITPENQGEAFDRIMNHMKGLAGDNLFVEDAGVSIENLCEVLSDTAKPGNSHIYFNFSTTETPEKKRPDGSVQYPARTWENWLGSKGLVGYTPHTPKGMARDNTKPTATTNTSTSAPSTNGATTKALPESVQYRDDNDLASLGKRGDAGDSEAVDQLKEFAARVGIDDDEVIATDSWKELAVKIANKGKSNTAKREETTTNEEPEEEEAFVPEVKGVYGLMVKGKKVKVRVEEVDEGKRTVTLKNLETKGTLKNVSFDNLEDGD